MTKGDGRPCQKCGTSAWHDSGNCIQCTRDRVKKWKKENPDRVEENHRNYRKNSPDKTLKSNQKWRKNNPDKANEIAKNWRDNNLEKSREISRRTKKKNRVKATILENIRRARKAETGGFYTTEEWTELCERYDNRCLCCKKKKKLTFDHVIPVSKGGSSNIENGQPLCGSCNSRKGTKTIDYRT